MRITATTLLAISAVASAKSSPDARKLQNNQNWDGNNNYGNSNVNSYMNNLNTYKNVRDQTQSYGNNAYGAQQNYNYGSQQNWGQNYDQEIEDWQESSAVQNSRYWGGSSSGGGDISWMSNYNIKFDGCATDYDSDRNGATKTELLAKFKLCPKNSNRCRNAGQYVVPMSQYVNAFENVVMTDDKCRAQQSTCYSMCQGNSMYGNGGGRRLANNNDKNNKDQNQNSNGHWWNWSKWTSGNNKGANNEQYDETVYNSESWQQQQKEKQQQYDEEYGYNEDADENSEEYQQYQQAKAQYYQNVDYSQYNGGNYQNAAHNGDYDGASANNGGNVDYESYQQEVEESNNAENNNYYNRDNSNWRDQDEYGNYFDAEYCRMNCMSDAGMSYCDGGNGASQAANENAAQGYEYNEMDIPSLVECHQLDYYSSDSQQLWVGAACKNGGVYLETFLDSTCSRTAPKNTHENAVGYSLPSQNLVRNDELSCDGTMTFIQASRYNQQQNNYQEDGQEEEEGGQQQQQYYAQNSVSVCDALYPSAGKCETHMKISNKNNGGCGYINRMNGRSGFSKWLRYGIGLVLAACFLIAAFVGYSKSRHQGDLQVTVKTIHASVSETMNSAANTLDGAIKQAEKSLSERLAPVDDSATVASAESAPSTAEYVGAEIPAEAAAPEKAAVV